MYDLAGNLSPGGMVRGLADPGVYIGQIQQGFTDVFGEGLHGALNAAGFIPVFGAVFDLANAGLYAYEGDYENAAWSAFAAIPGIGDVAGIGKLGARAAGCATKGAAAAGRGTIRLAANVGAGGAQGAIKGSVSAARAGSGAISSGASTTLSIMSNLYHGKAYVYVIFRPDGSIFKFGETARGFNRSGELIRASEGVRNANAVFGNGHYSVVLAEVASRRAARELEHRYIETFRKTYGHWPFGNPFGR